MKFNKLSKVILTSLIVFNASTAFSANQGTVGSTSTGDFDINFLRNGQIVIKNLADITLPQTANDDGDLVAWNNVCVAATTATEYSITAVNSSGTFELAYSGSDAGGTSAPYAIHFADSVGSEASTPLDNSNILENGVITGRFVPETSDPISGCSTNNATIWVKIAAADIPAIDGTYSDTVTVTVAPN